MIILDTNVLSALMRSAPEPAVLAWLDIIPVDVRDTQIAGIAIARRAKLATRNLRHFDDLPMPVLSPWA